MIEYHIIEIYHVLHMYSTEYFSKWRTSIKYYFLLIAILEADFRYINNINIVYNDTDDVVTNRRWFTYIEKEIMAKDLIQILRPRPRS